MPEAAAPPTPSSATDVRRIACPGCGATLHFAAGASTLHCDYCDHDQDVPHDAGTAPIQTHTLEELLNSKVDKGWGTEMVSFECKDCGAGVTLPPNQVAGRCPFCDNEVVVQRTSDPNLIRPETMIPFKLDKNAAVEHFRKWLAGLWFRPNNLKRMADLSEIKGVYTPYWTFDASAQSRWRAESGYYYYTTETYQDNEGTHTREVRHTRWQPSSGEHATQYVDVLICASSLVKSLVEDLEPFNTQKELVPYQPEYLSGWLAEEYKVGPAEGWQRGNEKMLQLEHEACDGQVPGDEHRNLHVATRLDNIKWKHVLLPIWIAAYRYNGKTYHFMVNGESGRVSGESPLSWYKIITLVLFIVALIWGIVEFKTRYGH